MAYELDRESVCSVWMSGITLIVPDSRKFLAPVELITMARGAIHLSK